jgi:hypothetical protein
MQASLRQPEGDEFPFKLMRARAVLANVRTLSDELMRGGVNVLTDGTDTRWSSPT